ncbi:pilus assembly protein PilP [Acinetobacter apis]|uniref:Type IV pilus assembly protein PilP n=1 Tax=Acinetobacter apis TaxID=1229165 RepID=A0A217EGY0_9GAMM|nr:pilus assembly protein PilP [Acinetobacter apis]SNQ29763.1 type IV pilus assembly protein PilP [Acinetobacter apis]
MLQRLIYVACLVSLVTGCSSRIEDVENQIAEIKKQPPLKADEPPKFDTVPSFQYAAQNLRSPFLPSSLYRELSLNAGKRVYPNLSRQAEPLESFPLESLLMRGTMKNAKGQLIALIQAPTKQVYRVEVGSHLGLNQGRIVGLNSEGLQILEIVSDGQDGYVERPRSLILIGQIS